MRKGYKIELLEAYEFKKSKDLFCDFIDLFSGIKANGETKSIRMFGKLVSNSLYGRFGLKFYSLDSRIVNKKDLFNLEQQHSCIYKELYGDNYYVRFNKMPLNVCHPDFLEKYKGVLKDDYNTESSVQIASAVASYARILLYNYMCDTGAKLYYTDTDSIYVDRPIDPKYIGNDLGLMKNELADANYTVEKDYKYFWRDGLFLQPKVKMLRKRKCLYRTRKRKDGYRLTFKGFSLKYIKNVPSYRKIWKIFKTVLSKESRDKKLYEFEQQKIRVNMNGLKIETCIRGLKLNNNFNKRHRLYNINGKWVDTSPLYIYDNIVDDVKTYKKKLKKYPRIYFLYKNLLLLSLTGFVVLSLSGLFFFSLLKSCNRKDQTLMSMHGI